MVPIGSKRPMDAVVQSSGNSFVLCGDRMTGTDCMIPTISMQPGWLQSVPLLGIIRSQPAS